MREWWSVLWCALVLSCAASDLDSDPVRELPPAVTPEDTDEPTGGGEWPGCPEVLETSSPLDGEVDVFFRDLIRMQLAAEPSDAEIEVADVDGNVIMGVTTIDGAEVLWEGDPLTPNARHTATLRIEGCEEQSIEFLVSSTGQPAGNVDDRVYLVDLTTGTWTEPPGIGPVITDLIPIETLWVSPDIIGDQIAMIAAFIDPFGNQADCLPTLPFAATPFEDPWFSSSTAVLPFELQFSTITLRDVSLTGAFAPNGGRIDALDLTGTLDVREIEPLLPPGTDVCGLVELFGSACFACPDAVEACATLTVENLDAALDPGAVVVERTPADIAADPLCSGYP